MGSHLFIVCVLSHLACIVMVDAQVKLSLKDEKNSEFLFEGENVTMVCRSLEEVTENMTFVISLNGTFVIVNRIILPGREYLGFSNVIKTEKQLEFTITSVTTMNSGVYGCNTTSIGNAIATDQFHLNIHRDDEVLCEQNTTAKYIYMDSLHLTCYFTYSVDDGSFTWVKQSNDGSSSVIPSTIIRDGIKRELIAVVEPSHDLTTSNYTCQSSMASGKRCTVGPYVISDQPFLSFTPDITTLAPGDSVNISCKHTFQSKFEPGTTERWDKLNFSEGVSAHGRDSDILIVKVASKATDGSYVMASCTTFAAMSISPRDLHISVQNKIASPPTRIPVSTQTQASTVTMDLRTQDEVSEDSGIISVITLIIINNFVIFALVGIIVFVVCSVKRLKSASEDRHGIPDTRDTTPYNTVDKIDSQTNPSQHVVQTSETDLGDDEYEMTQTEWSVGGDPRATGRQYPSLPHDVVNKNRQELQEEWTEGEKLRRGPRVDGDNGGQPRTGHNSNSERERDDAPILVVGSSDHNVRPTSSAEYDTTIHSSADDPKQEHQYSEVN